MKTITTILFSLLIVSQIHAGSIDIEQTKSSTELEIKVYPNPTTGTLQISSCDNIEEIKLYNLTGKEVVSKANECKLSLENLPNGIYILKVITSEKTITKRIVKKSE